MIAGAMLTIPSVGQGDKPGDASEGKPAQTAADCAETVRSVRLAVKGTLVEFTADDPATPRSTRRPSP